LEVFEFEKYDKTIIERFKFWKNLAQTHTKEPSHRFLNVRTEPEILSKRKNLTTLVQTS